MSDQVQAKRVFRFVRNMQGQKVKADKRVSSKNELLWAWISWRFLGVWSTKDGKFVWMRSRGVPATVNRIPEPRAPPQESLYY